MHTHLNSNALTEDSCSCDFIGICVTCIVILDKVVKGYNSERCIYLLLLTHTHIMNSTKVQNARRKMQVALLAEPKTPLESSVFIYTTV